MDPPNGQQGDDLDRVARAQADAARIGAVDEAVNLGDRGLGSQHLLLAAVTDPLITLIGTPVGIHKTRLRELVRVLVGQQTLTGVADPRGVYLLPRTVDLLEQVRAASASTNQIASGEPEPVSALRHRLFQVLLSDSSPSVARLVLSDVDRSALMRSLTRAVASQNAMFEQRDAQSST